MSLSLLLDEQMSPVIAERIVAKHPSILIQSVFRWRGGELTATEDAYLLQYAAEDRLTLVTYDQKTISPILTEWSAQGFSHGGVLFVNRRTYKTSDFGGLIQALTEFWVAHQDEDWTDRIDYLRRM
jgi:hypothetical protein